MLVCNGIISGVISGVINGVITGARCSGAQYNVVAGMSCGCIMILHTDGEGRGDLVATDERRSVTFDGRGREI